METRRVQSTGGASFVMTLPKRWVQRFGVDVSRSVRVSMASDGALIVRPVSGESDMIRSAIIDADMDGSLFRRLIGAYISGIQEIRVKASTVDKDMKSTVSRFVSVAMGMEVVEEDSSGIVIKDLINPAELPMHRSMRMMSSLVVSMITDVIRALKFNDVALADGVKARDNDVDKYHYHLLRQFNMLCEHPAYLEDLDVDYKTGARYILLSRTLERIGDHSVKMASMCGQTMDSDLMEPVLNTCAEAINRCIRHFGSMGSDEIVGVLNEIDNVIEILSKAMEDAGYCPIMESARRISHYTRDLLEISLDHVLDIEWAKTSSAGGRSHAFI